MHDTLTHLAHAIRVLRKNPGFTLSALAILTLGIGANTAIFSVVNAVLLRPLPFPDSSAVVSLYHVPPANAFPGIKQFSVSAANYLDWRKSNDVFESMSMYRGRVLRVGGSSSRPEVLTATNSDAGLFQVLRARPALGRVFTEAECQPGRDNVIVLSHTWAETHFGSPAAALGRTLILDNRNVEVIGVMPPDFHMRSWFPASTDGWVPLAWTEQLRAERRNHNFLVVARLRDGVSVAQANTAMAVISDRLARDYPDDDKGWGAVVLSLREDLVGDVRPALLALLGAVGFVLLIACANTANLVLARTIARRKELAIRAALGASTSQVLRPVLLESLVLSLTGGALGLIVARFGQRLVTAALADQLPRATEVQLDARVLAFTLVASVVTGLAAGLIAGSRLLRADLNDSLKQGLGKTDASAAGRGTRSALVVAEVALSVVLLVGAGLMVRTLVTLNNADPGFRPANVVTLALPRLIPLDQTIPPEARGSRLYDQFLPAISALPGVDSVAAVDSLPLQGGSEQPIAVEGRPNEVFALQRNVSVRRATPNYFRTMGIRLISGRDFARDDLSGDRRVAVISQAMAKYFWPGEQALGKRFRISFTPDIVYQVVGIVSDIRQRGLDVLDPVTMLYLPIRHDTASAVRLVVRGTGAANLTAAITSAIAMIDPELPVRDVRTMDDIVATTLAQRRFSMWLFAALAGLAVLLASVGIYSVLAYSVRSRVREIGVRMALGATPAQVLRLVILEGMKPTLIGVAAGAIGAVALSGVLSRLIFGVEPTDPLTFAAVITLLACLALAACIIPGHRATRVEPVEALRNE